VGWLAGNRPFGQEQLLRTSVGRAIPRRFYYLLWESRQEGMELIECWAKRARKHQTGLPVAGRVIQGIRRQPPSLRCHLSGAFLCPNPPYNLNLNTCPENRDHYMRRMVSEDLNSMPRRNKLGCAVFASVSPHGKAGPTSAGSGSSAPSCRR
jgi:hypothetical protein